MAERQNPPRRAANDRRMANDRRPASDRRTASDHRAANDHRPASDHRMASDRQAPPRRNDVIRCERCGEDYAITYRRCPFCDERPARGGSVSYSPSGRRAASNTRGGGYGRPVNPIQIVALVISMVLIIAALFIVFTKLAPLFSKDKDNTPAASSSQMEAPGDITPDPAPSASAEDPGSSAEIPSDVILAQGISLSREDFTLAPNEFFKVTAAVYPTDTTEEIVWSSSNTQIATVDQNGLVTNVNMGGTKESAVITVSCGGVSAECIVRCNPGGTSGSSGSSGSSGPVSSGSTGTVVNAGNGLNVRSGPGSSHEKVASISNGSRVTILEDAGNGWYKIDYGNGKVGYVSADYISVR